MKTNIGSYHISRFPESVFVPSQKIAIVHGWGWEGSEKMIPLLFSIRTNGDERKASDNINLFFESCDLFTSVSILIFYREIK